MKDPKATVLLFHSGKVVCTGAKSLTHAQMAVEKLTKQLKEAGIKVKTEPKVEIQNIVASSDLGQTIKLNAVAISLGLERVEYDPEQFSGIVYRSGCAEGSAIDLRVGKVGLRRCTETAGDR